MVFAMANELFNPDLSDLYFYFFYFNFNLFINLFQLINLIFILIFTLYFHIFIFLSIATHCQESLTRCTAL